MTAVGEPAVIVLGAALYAMLVTAVQSPARVVLILLGSLLQGTVEGAAQHVGIDDADSLRRSAVRSDRDDSVQYARAGSNVIVFVGDPATKA